MKFTASLSDLKIYNEIHFGLEIKSARAQLSYYYAVVKNKEFLILQWELLRFAPLVGIFQSGCFYDDSSRQRKVDGVSLLKIPDLIK